MKRYFIILGILLMANPGFTVDTFSALGPQTQSTSSFSNIKQYSFNKNETLDFVNDAEGYKSKREQKEKKANFLNNNNGLAVPESYTNNYNGQEYSRPGSNNLRFVKDENGKIRIQGY